VSVFAGDRPAELDAHGEDLPGQLVGPLDRLGLTPVKEDQRMEVAVTGVEDVGNPRAQGTGPGPRCDLDTPCASRRSEANHLTSVVSMSNLDRESVLSA
jgi:hypothetical protein